MLDRLKIWAVAIKRDTFAIYLAARDPRVPWYAKCLAVAVAGYAFSPIDLIPDFVPVLGYLDDLIVIPVGIALVVWMVPPDVMAEHRRRAASRDRPVSRMAAAAVVAVWVLAAIVTLWLIVSAMA